MAYDIPGVKTSFDHVYVPLPCGPWRSVAYSQTGFVVESFIDELAHRAGSLVRPGYSNEERLASAVRVFHRSGLFTQNRRPVRTCGVSRM